MKKVISLVLILVLSLTFIACENKGTKENTEKIEAGDTVGSKYLATFANSNAADVDTMVSELLALDAAGTELLDMEVSEGYLDGFDGDISGFSYGKKFSPMIGSIPFVGYVLESDDPSSLLDMLKTNANPAWNICTEADETVSYVRGNLVFFLMCPNEN